MLPVKIKEPIVKVQRVKGIRVIPFTLLVVFLITMTSFVVRTISPVVVEKTVTFVKRDTVITIDSTAVKQLNELKKKIDKENNSRRKEIGKRFKELQNRVGVNEIKEVEKIKGKNIARLHGYTPFEIAMYFLKAHESFRPYAYPDGKYKSKGFGLNLTPDHIKWANKILGFKCTSRNWTYEEGTKLLYAYWQEMKDSHPEIKDDFKLVALLLHKYNTGNTNSLAGCCGSKKGCGRGLKSHKERRIFEVRLYNHKVTKEEIEKYRNKAIIVDAKWK